MPLDTGAVAEFDRLASAAKDRVARGPGGAVLDTSVSLGFALRAAREAGGLTVNDIARATRVRPGHVEAIENSDLGALPSRPFAMGYIRAYAAVLGVDPDRAVGRFRAEAPEVDSELRGPGGIAREAPRRFRRLAICATLVLTALVGWNFSRHALAKPPRVNRSLVAAADSRPRPALGPAHLGAPLPAPAEATTPAVYETPGLAASVAGRSPGAAGPPPRPDRIASESAGAPFVAAGTIYGASSGASGIPFQARNATSLVVRGQNGAVYFARQLSAGQAWRAPALPGLIVDAGNPASIEVFVAGFSRGALTQPLTPVSRFAG